MGIWGDYHTHTVYSHGKGTIEENVLRAIKIGLKEIAITDHGFRHGAYHVRRMDWPFVVDEVRMLKLKYPMINIYLGLETNLIHTDGAIDILPQDMENLDIVVCGYHKYVRSRKISEFFKLTAPNFILDTLGKSSKKQTVRNTDAYVKALERYDIDIISHPNNDLKTDVTVIAEAAAFYGTYLELNGKHVTMSDKEIESILSLTKANFIADSDAHSVKRIGEISKPLAVIDRINIPKDRIANWDKLPVFRSRIKRGFYNGTLKQNCKNRDC